MRWFRKHTNDSPRLISLSPLRHSDQIDDSILSYYSHRNLNENDTSTSSSLPQTPISNKSRSYCTTTPPSSKSSTLSGASCPDTVNLRKSRIGNYCFYIFMIIFLDVNENHSYAFQRCYQYLVHDNWVIILGILRDICFFF